MEEKVTITLSEYNELLENRAFLDCLEACGVDNWDGYSDARMMMEDEFEEDYDF